MWLWAIDSFHNNLGMEALLKVLTDLQAVLFSHFSFVRIHRKHYAFMSIIRMLMLSCRWDDCLVFYLMKLNSIKLAPCNALISFIYDSGASYTSHIAPHISAWTIRDYHYVDYIRRNMLSRLVYCLSEESLYK